eukprot:gene28719-47093_t
MPGWASLKAEWVGAGDADSYTLSVPSPWREKGVLLFGSRGAPLLTPQFQTFHNRKIRRKELLRFGAAVAAVVPDDAAGGVELALRHFLGRTLRLKSEHAAALAAASLVQVCAMLAATFEGGIDLPPLADAGGAWRRTYDADAAQRDLAAELDAPYSGAPAVRGSPQRWRAGSDAADAAAFHSPAAGGGAAAAEEPGALADVLRAMTTLNESVSTLTNRVGRLEGSRRVAVESPRPSPTPSVAGDDAGYSTYDDDDAHHPDRWDPDASDTDSDATDYDADLDDLDA